MDWTWGWTAVGAIATCVLAVGIVFAILQVREARKSTNARIAMSLFSELRNSETIEKLRHIYELKPDGAKYLSISQQEDMDYVLDRLDTLGNLVIKGIVDKELAIETYGGPPALRFWYKLKDYIKTMQNYRGYYGENFEAFVRLSLDYFREKGIEVKFYRKGEEDKGIDLVSKLQEDEFRPRSLEEIKRERKMTR